MIRMKIRNDEVGDTPEVSGFCLGDSRYPRGVRILTGGPQIPQRSQEFVTGGPQRWGVTVNADGGSLLTLMKGG